MESIEATSIEKKLMHKIIELEHRLRVSEFNVASLAHSFIACEPGVYIFEDDGDLQGPYTLVESEDIARENKMEGVSSTIIEVKARFDAGDSGDEVDVDWHNDIDLPNNTACHSNVPHRRHAA